MRVVRSIADGLLYSNAWVALCLAVLVLGYAHYHCITDCWLYALFAFSGTYATYNFHRLIRQSGFTKAAIETERGTWMNEHRRLMLISCIAAVVGCALLLFFLPMALISFALLGISGLIVLFYVLPVPGLNRTLRHIPGIKNTWIVLVWVILVVLPLLNRGLKPNASDLILIGLFVFVQIIPFDIRDALYDRREMYTLPQLIGKTSARITASALVVVILTGLLTNGHNPFLLIAGVSSLAGIWWKQTSRNIRSLEFLWEVPLLFLGLFYYLLPCLAS